jgi:hypothetical protein
MSAALTTQIKIYRRTMLKTVAIDGATALAEKAQAYPMGVNTNSHSSKLAQNLGSLRLNTAKSLAIPAAASIHNAGHRLSKGTKDAAREGGCCKISIGRSSRASSAALIRAIQRRTASSSCRRFGTDASGCDVAGQRKELDSE